MAGAILFGSRRLLDFVWICTQTLAYHVIILLLIRNGRRKWRRRGRRKGSASCPNLQEEEEQRNRKSFAVVVGSERGNRGKPLLPNCLFFFSAFFLSLQSASGWRVIFLINAVICSSLARIILTRLRTGIIILHAPRPCRDRGPIPGTAAASTAVAIIWAVGTSSLICAAACNSCLAVTRRFINLHREKKYVRVSETETEGWSVFVYVFDWETKRNVKIWLTLMEQMKK